MTLANVQDSRGRCGVSASNGRHDCAEDVEGASCHNQRLQQFEGRVAVELWSGALRPPAVDLFVWMETEVDGRDSTPKLRATSSTNGVHVSSHRPFRGLIRIGSSVPGPLLRRYLVVRAPQYPYKKEVNCSFRTSYCPIFFLVAKCVLFRKSILLPHIILEFSICFCFFGRLDFYCVRR